MKQLKDASKKVEEVVGTLEGKAKKETNRSVGLEESDAPKPKKRAKK